MSKEQPATKCGWCGCEVMPADMNLEAFELSGEILCPECAEGFFEDEANPHEGAAEEAPDFGAEYADDSDPEFN